MIWGVMKNIDTEILNEKKSKGSNVHSLAIYTIK